MRKTAVKKNRKASSKKSTAGKPAVVPASDTPEVTWVLRSNAASMISQNGFVWPESGPVECPDWRPTKACGNGLHGLLMGLGDQSLLNWDTDAKWLVVEVVLADVVAIDNQKVKFPRGVVVYCGDRGGAIDLLVSKGADPSKLPAGQASASGYQGQASASGVRGQASASGYQGQASASGDQGQASASGVRGQASASGYQGQASASGYQGQASASGVRGQASASGDRGQASASGYQGQASASGVRGRTIAGQRGRAKAGELGILILFHHDAAADRERAVVRYVGEDNIKADTFYRLNDAGEVIECTDEEWKGLDWYNQAFTAKAFECALDAARLWKE